MELCEFCCLQPVDKAQSMPSQNVSIVESVRVKLERMDAEFDDLHATWNRQQLVEEEDATVEELEAEDFNNTEVEWQIVPDCKLGKTLYHDWKMPRLSKANRNAIFQRLRI